MRVLILLLSIALPLSSFAQDNGTMRAIQIQEFGGPEVLQVHEISRPIAAEGELLLRVHAAGINPVDTGVRSGGASSLSGVSERDQ